MSITRSKATLATVALGAVAILIPSSSLAGQAGAAEVTARLKGQNEVPGPGDPDGRGRFEAKLKTAKKKVCFELSFNGLSDASAGHIHKGTEDVAGPIKLKLFNPNTGLSGDDELDKCVKAERRLIRKLEGTPGDFYVNVHNPEYPDGAIRGQLRLPRGA